MSTMPVIKSQALIADHAAADAEYQRMAALAEQAQKEFERRKLSASATKFAELRDAADQAQLRADAAHRVRDEKRAALGAFQAAELEQTRRAEREQTLASKQAEFDAARDQLLRHRAELETLLRIVPGEEIKLGFLMKQLSELRGAHGA